MAIFNLMTGMFPSSPRHTFQNQTIREIETDESRPDARWQPPL
jgi:hypothetical protein